MFERVWGYDFGATSNTLGVYIGYLRRKTEAGGEPRLLHTVRGVGYVLRGQREVCATASRCSPRAAVGDRRSCSPRSSATSRCATSCASRSTGRSGAGRSWSAARRGGRLRLRANAQRAHADAARAPEMAALTQILDAGRAR